MILYTRFIIPAKIKGMIGTIGTIKGTDMGIGKFRRDRNEIQGTISTMRAPKQGTKGTKGTKGMIFGGAVPRARKARYTSLLHRKFDFLSFFLNPFYSYCALVKLM